MSIVDEVIERQLKPSLATLKGGSAEIPASGPGAGRFDGYSAEIERFLRSVAIVEAGVTFGISSRTQGAVWDAVGERLSSDTMRQYCSQRGLFLAMRFLERLQGPSFDREGDGAASAGSIDIDRGLYRAQVENAFTDMVVLGRMLWENPFVRTVRGQPETGRDEPGGGGPEVTFHLPLDDAGNGQSEQQATASLASVSDFELAVRELADAHDALTALSANEETARALVVEHFVPDAARLASAFARMSANVCKALREAVDIEAREEVPGYVSATGGVPGGAASPLLHPRPIRALGEYRAYGDAAILSRMERSTTVTISHLRRFAPAHTVSMSFEELGRVLGVPAVEDRTEFGENSSE